MGFYKKWVYLMLLIGCLFAILFITESCSIPEPERDDCTYIIYRSDTGTIECKSFSPVGIPTMTNCLDARGYKVEKVVAPQNVVVYCNFTKI